MLRDGRRCLVRDRSGGLQTFDLRHLSGRAGGREGARGHYQGPLRVLVSPAPGRWAAASGKFALDPGETVVATPIASDGGGWARRGAACVDATHPLSAIASAWNPFSTDTTPNDRSSHCTPRGTDSNGAGAFRGDAGATDDDVRRQGRRQRRRWPRVQSDGDGLRVLKINSGEVVSEMSTPHDALSLARGTVGSAGAKGVVGESGFYHGNLVFRGLATGPGQGGARVLVEVALWPEGEET